MGKRHALEDVVEGGDDHRNGIVLRDGRLLSLGYVSSEPWANHPPVAA